MFSQFDCAATVAVKDLTKARAFYEQTLGLKPEHEEGEEAVTYRTGASSLIVYRSQYAGSNKATAVTWNVGDAVTDIVRKLGEKGVKPEKYDMDGMEESGGVYSAGGMQIAWFKDPDGNVLGVCNAPSQAKAKPKAA